MHAQVLNGSRQRRYLDTNNGRTGWCSKIAPDHHDGVRGIGLISATGEG